MVKQILKKISLWICLFGPFLGEAGIGRTRQNQGQGNNIKIGVAMDSLREENRKKFKEGFEQRAQELGVELSILSANNDNLRQIAQAKELVDSGVNVLVVIPVSSKGSVPIVEYAHSKDIPVISYNRLILDADVDAYVSPNHMKLGQMAVEYLTKIVPTGNYIYIGGDPDSYNAVLHREGALDALKPYLDSGAIRLVYNKMAPAWSPVIAQEQTEEALEANNNNISAVIVANDNLAGGVIAALGEQRLAGKVPVAGSNADLAALHRILEGTQTMTIYRPIKDLVDGVMDTAIAFAKKEPFNPNTTIFNGKVDVPTLVFDSILVDKSNIENTVIQDGYHTYEEVYKTDVTV